MHNPGEHQVEDAMSDSQFGESIETMRSCLVQKVIESMAVGYIGSALICTSMVEEEEVP